MNLLTDYELDKTYVSFHQQTLLNQTRHLPLEFPSQPGTIRRVLGESLIRLGEHLRGRHQQCLAESQRETFVKLAS